MESKKALILSGGWVGHSPAEIAAIYIDMLTKHGYDCTNATELDVLDDADGLRLYDLIIPNWTMGKITHDQCRNVCNAVESGVGLAGCHGGMCDAFRENTDWQFLTGGQWVAHPGNEFRHQINIGPQAHAITADVHDFFVETEQYYMHVDPAVKVHATTRFPMAAGPHVANGLVDMPVIWTKLWGTGRVYYNALGHRAAVLEAEPVQKLMRRGMKWAAR